MTSAAAVEFPPLGGPYQVGKASYHLVDAVRKEIFTPAGDDVRELMITVHYPATVPAGQTASPYADDALASAWAEVSHKPLSVFKSMRSHAVEKAPVVKKDGGFPVVLFSPGFKSLPLFYTAMLEELASQGFIVVSLSHPYSTAVTVFPDGRVVRANDEGTRFEVDKKNREFSPATMLQHRDAIGDVWVADQRFVADSLEEMNRNDTLLAGHLDLSHLGAFGHSFGGATAAASVERDKRFRAGINLDGSDLSGTHGDAIGDRFLWLASEPPDFAKLPMTRPAPGSQPQSADPKTPAKGPQPTPPADGKAQGTRVVLKRPGDADGPPRDLPRFRPNNGLRAPDGCLITLAGSRAPDLRDRRGLAESHWGNLALCPGADVGTIEGHRAVAVINALVSGFFRKHLRGENVSCLDKDSKEFPEAIWGPLAGAVSPAQVRVRLLNVSCVNQALRATAEFRFRIRWPGRP